MESQTRERIIEAAVELFNFRGYRNVTLAEIAEHLGISKKTIYQFFTGKDEIAEGVLCFLSTKMNSKIREIKDLNLDPAIKLREIIKLSRTGLSKINPLFLEDIRKYIPNLEEELKKIKQERIFLFEAIVREGQAMGTFRSDIDARLAAITYYEILLSVHNPAIITRLGGYSPEHSVDQVTDFLLEVYLKGISNHH
ncbi:MAG: TetR/AcrR family transcriptional regulator [Syntrophomonadaceae bacterium]|nr:TetR/AcrR family transcriptional regulator [Syntrophomonadaceae bacterium]